MTVFSSHEWLLGRVRSSFELEGAQVEQLENQLRAEGGVAAKPSGGKGVPGILAGAVGGDSGASHAGDGRAGAGKSQGNDMLNNALGGSMAGQLALGAMSGGGLLGMPGAKSGASAASGPAATAEGTEQAEVAQQLTGEGEDVATVADTAQQEEVDKQEMEEGEGPPEGDVQEMMGKAPDVSVADLYKYYGNRLARRARQAAILADKAVQEAWKQQQLARYWTRQALEDEAKAMRAMRSLPPPKGDPEQDTHHRLWHLHVPPGWELPPAPLVSTRDPRSVSIYSGSFSEPLLAAAPSLPCSRRRRTQVAAFLVAVA